MSGEVKFIGTPEQFSNLQVLQYKLRRENFTLEPKITRQKKEGRQISLVTFLFEKQSK